VYLANKWYNRIYQARPIRRDLMLVTNEPIAYIPLEYYELDEYVTKFFGVKYESLNSVENLTNDVYLVLDKYEIEDLSGEDGEDVYHQEAIDKWLADSANPAIDSRDVEQPMWQWVIFWFITRGHLPVANYLFHVSW